MIRSVSQLLFSYLPYRTVNWEDGGGVVQLDTPRLESSWSATQSKFVLDEISDYVDRWRSLGGEIHPLFPSPRQSMRFTVGPPAWISAHALPTAFYCRVCFRFLPKLRSGPHRFDCPECRRPTLRQISTVFVHGCGELVPIRDAIPYESQKQPGTIFRAPIRCPRCGDQGILRIDARSERLAATRIYCDRCKANAIDRLLARCPYCLPRLFGQNLPGGQLAFRTAMRLTRHSANNAYYPHSVTILRLDRPRALQASEEISWLQTLLPVDERREAAGVSATLQDLVLALASAEILGDATRTKELREAIQAAAAASPAAPSTNPNGNSRVAMPEDLVQSARESIALVSTVRRTDVTRLYDRTDQSNAARNDAIRRALTRLGIRRIEYVEDLPVITSVFGFSRRSADPIYREEAANQDFPTTIRPFPSLDDDAARVLQRPQAAGTTPILAREGTHEGLAIFLEPRVVFAWLAELGLPTPEITDQDRLASLLGSLESMIDDKYHDRVWTRPRRRLVFGLLHTLSHCAMLAMSRTAGLEETSVSEYLFLPLLSTVVYSTSSTSLGGVRATARDRLFEFLENLEDEAMRCLYDPDCLQRAGACHGCIHVPEIGCRVFNHGLSRALLVGGQAPWTPASQPNAVPGFWTIAAHGA